MNDYKILLAGDTNRTQDMLDTAEFLRTEYGARVTCIPLGKADAHILLPSISALVHGQYNHLHLDNGWSHSPTSVILKLIADVIGIDIDYSPEADTESTPTEMHAELEGFSKGMLSAHQFIESLEE